MTGHTTAQARHDLRTNIEQRAFILGMLEAGASGVSAARAVGVTTQRVSQVASWPRPERVRRLTEYVDSIGIGTAVCADCDEPLRRDSALVGAVRCKACHQRYETRASRSRRARLEAWATRHRVVPTATQAAQVLGISRSRAAEHVVEVFGPDNLSPVERRHDGPRPYRPASRRRLRGAA